MDAPRQHPKAPGPKQIVRLTLLFYLPMAGSLYFIKPPASIVGGLNEKMLWGMVMAVAGGAMVVGLSRFVTHGTRWGAAMYQEFQQALGGLDSRQILLLSLLSAVGEEALFRGALHPRLGLWVTALLFAGLHFPYRKTLVPWSLFALVLGVFLGLLTDFAQSLWPAIFLHFFINYFNLHDIARPPGTGAKDDENPAGPGQNNDAEPPEEQSNEQP